MCCRVQVKPLDMDLAAAMLVLGQFEKFDYGWVRRLEEEGTAVYAKFHSSSLELNINPVITNMSGHAGHRIAGGVMFEMGWRYAEKVNGTMEQHATVIECMVGRKSIEVIAVHPDMPLKYEQVCIGFRKIFLPTEEELT